MHGSLWIPVISTAFYIKPTGPDSAQISGCSALCNVLPIPWSVRANREGQRLVYHYRRGIIHYFLPRSYGTKLRELGPNTTNYLDFNSGGNYFCAKGKKDEPVWCGYKVCGSC